VYEIPLYYISFKKKPEIEDYYRNFGFTNINQFQAIDGRKMDIDMLRRNKVISLRAYDDLKSGRREHSGMSTKGAIGCGLSHYNLWKKCADEHDFLIIAEDDNRIKRKLTDKDLENINNTLSKPNSVWNSVKIGRQEHRIHFFGCNFYIISNGASKVLVQDFFPMDVQCDWYMAHKATLGEITVEGFPITEQTTARGKSTVQEPASCIVCLLPKSRWFYVSIILFIILIVVGIVYYRKKYTVCLESCESFRE
jgi:GR25 family glycosyltransferase involved in LPS biosynthesis